MPLSRPKVNLHADFADGVMTTEIMKRYLPKVVLLHHVITSQSLNKRRENWVYLNSTVFPKIGFAVTAEEVERIITETPGAIEGLLLRLRRAILASVAG
eukprot:TRINITY_DN4845_c0_g1_i6.p1 TRINITY_DN4845_c0_g1~~TRINITY_DN4845_c0_g1_i6.p1  ORF type:complete len:112 (+),score=22.69 TRINITY_DN4845_c0_g1_i6:42-338(+)